VLWQEGNLLCPVIRDGSTLTVVDTQIGKIGGLVCWEHWMPLARYAMHAKEELIHIAQWPAVEEMEQVVSRAYAFEGRCFVVAAGTVMQRRAVEELELDLLEEIPGSSESFLLRGGSCIIGPDGTILGGPLYDQEGLVSAEIHPQQVVDARLTLDVTGHYSRPDVFQLVVNAEPQSNIQWRGG
jgi:predicted amidohydrolase